MFIIDIKIRVGIARAMASWRYYICTKTLHSWAFIQMNFLPYMRHLSPKPVLGMRRAFI